MAAPQARAFREHSSQSNPEQAAVTHTDIGAWAWRERKAGALLHATPSAAAGLYATSLLLAAHRSPFKLPK